MPLYEYQCEACGVRFERRQHMNDEPVRICPECRGQVHRLVQPVGVIFKGSGFYVTDNRSKSSTSGTKTTKTPSEASKESKPAADKSDTKSEKSE
jgi:putative FmdB family regulatory protein